ncbi:MAG: hypothetical protein JNL36_05035 [Candidatus Kapabacteria bacterium]|nr:hypothetical protein [Candidatus Kapabacteria bacterium]
MFAQTQKATTESGVKVILNSDGTWDFDREKTEQKKISILDTIDCSKWISSEIDKVNGKSNLTAKIRIVGDDNEGNHCEGSIEIIKSNKGHLELNFDLAVYYTEQYESVCMSHPEIKILTVDEKRATWQSEFNKPNCSGAFSVLLGGIYSSNDVPEGLKKHKIKMIRIQLTNLDEKEFIDIEFDNKTAEEFIKIMNCLYK